MYDSFLHKKIMHTRAHQCACALRGGGCVCGEGEREREREMEKEEEREEGREGRREGGKTREREKF